MSDGMGRELAYLSSHATNRYFIPNWGKDYPMSGIFEDLVDELVEESPANVLRLWLDDKDERDLVLHSANYVNRCLYSLHLKKFDSFIEVNPIWKKYLVSEQSNLLSFIRESLVAFLNR